MENTLYTFNMPDIGEGVVEGEVIQWLKNVGDHIQQDEPVVIVMTDKATVELPSPYPGILAKQYYQAGETAIKDKPLYDIKVEGAIEKPLTSSPKPPSTKHPEPVQKGKKAHVKEHKQEAALAIPKVRHLAHELDVDLETISGTGPQGRITLEDLKQTTPVYAAVTQLEGDKVESLIGIRGLMARKMDQSKSRLAQFSYFEEVDVTRLIQMRQNFKQKALEEDIHLSYMPFFIRALSLTANQYPIVNSSIDMQSEKIIFHHPHNIGIAMASAQGLIVPVLKDVESMSLEAIIKAYEQLKQKALSNQLTSADMKKATLTLSNFGVLGGEGLWATPMLSDPEVAILAVARIRKAPVVKNQEIVIRDILPVSWSFDHRIIDGELASTISHHFCTLLRDPAFLL